MIDSAADAERIHMTNDLENARGYGENVSYADVPVDDLVGHPTEKSYNIDTGTEATHYHLPRETTEPRLNAIEQVPASTEMKDYVYSSDSPVLTEHRKMKAAEEKLSEVRRTAAQKIKEQTVLEQQRRIKQADLHEGKITRAQKKVDSAHANYVLSLIHI